LRPLPQLRRPTKIALVLFALTAAAVAFGAPAHAETAVQRRACKGDVLFLCGKYIPRRGAIVRCLVRHLDDLSPACRAVFEGRLR